MRLSVQVCLILLPCLFFSGTVNAAGGGWTFKVEGYYCLENEALKRSQMLANAICDDPGIECKVEITKVATGCTSYTNGRMALYYRHVSTPEECLEEGKVLDPDLGVCVLAPQDPAECYENGLSYNNQTQQCVEVCEHGELNGICLNPPADNLDECTPETEGYKGYFDYGSSRRNVCETDNTCPGGVIGLVGSELQCVPNEYGPPECSGKEVLHVGEFGTYCALPNDAPQETQEPNTDTDGDGEPDEYRRENDPESVDKGLDKVTDELGQANNQLEGANNRLSAIRDEIRAGNNANEGNGSAIEQGITSGIGSAGDSATGQLDDHIDGIDTTAPMTSDDLSGIESTVSNVFGVSTQCTDIVFGTQELFYTITCQQMDKIRDLLGFLLYGFTVIRLFQIAVRPAAKGTP